MKKLLLGFSLFTSTVSLFATDYTWTGGGEDANWTTPANWSPSTDYPKSTADKAIFPRGKPIVVTINDNLTVGKIDLNDYNYADAADSINVVFRGKEGDDYGTNKLLTVTTLAVNAMNGYIALDRAAMKVSSAFTLGKRTLDIRNGSYFYCGNVTSSSAGTFMIRGDSVASVADYLQENKGSTFVLDDSYIYMRSSFTFCTANSTTDGGTTIFRGKNPRMRFAAGKCLNPRANGNYTITLIFEVPEDGFASAPISTDNATVDFPTYYGVNHLKFTVDPESPCYLKESTIDTPLVEWNGAKSILTGGKNIFGELPDGGYFEYGTSATSDYGWTDVAAFSGTAKAIGAHIVSTAHDDRLTVVTDEEVTVVPAAGVTNQSDVAVSGTIAFSAPVTSETDGVRCVCTGYTLAEIVKTASGSTTNFTEGTAASFDYTPAGKEVRVVWHFSKDYKVAYSTLNDASATVTVTAGSGYVKPGTDVTLTAATTDATKEFQYWYGDLPYADRYANPLTLTGEQALAVTAFFGNKKANAATISAESGNDTTAKSWFAPATWTGGVIPGTNDKAIVRWTGTSYQGNYRFSVTVPSFFAVGDLVISNAAVKINTAVQVDAVGYARADATDKTRTEAVGCDIFGDLLIDCYQLDSSKYYGWSRSINGGALCVGGTYQLAPCKLNVYGDLTIANGMLLVHAGYPFSLDWIDATKAVDGPTGFLPFDDLNAFFRGENHVKVCGKTTLPTPTRTDASGYVAKNAIQVINEFRTGAAVWLDFADTAIGEGCEISAYSGGYGKFNAEGLASGRLYSMCPGGHCNSDNTSGGSHGGAGGSEDKTYPTKKATSHVAVYDFENSPIYPGSANGGGGGLDKPGAGTIRLDCGTFDLEGSLLANGLDAAGNKGGSAGGSIWVSCKEFNPGENCSVQAKGGNSTGDNSGGGGGRVSICVDMLPGQMEDLFTRHAADEVSIAALADVLTTRMSVAGGTGTTTRSDGFDGTAVYIVNVAGKHTVTVAGDPSNYGSPEPAYGPHVMDEGDVITLDGPADAFVSDDNLSKRICSGYTVSDTNGTVLATGSGRTGSYTIATDCSIVWNLTTLVHKLEYGSTVGGSVQVNAMEALEASWIRDGSTVSLTAIPVPGYAFAGWYGELPTNLQSGADLTFTHEKARSVKALFVSTAAGAVTWTGAGDGSSWTDGANWSGGAVPGEKNEVTIPAGADVKADFCLPVTLRSLTVESGAKLTFGPNGAYSTFDTPQIAAKSSESDWQRITLTVTGDLTVGGTFSIGGKNSLAKFALTVGGALRFGENSKGYFYSAFNASQRFLDAPTDRYDNTEEEMQLAARYSVGGEVSVAGAFTIAAGAVVYPYGDCYSGASVRFDVGSFLLEEGGKIDADGKGWAYATYSSLTYSLSPTLRDGGTLGYGGGTYAGLGGQSDTHNPSSKIYGWAYSPIFPGSPGFNTFLAPGGGVVRIHADGIMRCYGTITAIGGYSGGTGGYCGAGGGIFLTGRTFRTGESAVITAAGRDQSYGTNEGAGGGGRVVIATDVNKEDIAALSACGTCPRIENGRIKVHDLSEEGVPARWSSCTITARGGVNERTAVAGRRYSGLDGTVIWLDGPPSGFAILLRADGTAGN